MNMSDFEDNEKVKLYAGLPSTQVLLTTFNVILPATNQQKKYYFQYENEIKFASTVLSLPVSFV